MPQTSALDIQTNALTLSAWVRLSDLPSSLPTPFADIYGSASDAYGFYLDRSAVALRFVVTDTKKLNRTPANRNGILMVKAN